MVKQINIADENDSIAIQLSNFTHIPFVFDDVLCTCAESFIQSLKFSNPEAQQKIAALEGYKARMKGKKQTAKVIESNCIYWKGNEIPLFGDDFYYLIYIALKEKFKQNKAAELALLLTENCELIFEGHPEPKFTLLSNDMFIKILILIREELRTS